MSMWVSISNSSLLGDLFSVTSQLFLNVTCNFFFLFIGNYPVLSYIHMDYWYGYRQREKEILLECREA